MTLTHECTREMHGRCNASRLGRVCECFCHRDMEKIHAHISMLEQHVQEAVWAKERAVESMQEAVRDWRALTVTIKEQANELRELRTQQGGGTGWVCQECGEPVIPHLRTSRFCQCNQIPAPVSCPTCTLQATVMT